MNRILSKFSLIIAMGLVTAGAWAQSPTGSLKATIPFDFTVNNTIVPAGTYMVSSENYRGHIVLLSNPAEKTRMFGVTVPESAKRGQRNALVFHKYGDRYFLSEIRCNGCAINSSLPVTKAEQWAKVHALDTADIPVVESDVLIALK